MVYGVVPNQTCGHTLDHILVINIDDSKCSKYQANVPTYRSGSFMGSNEPATLGRELPTIQTLGRATLAGIKHTSVYNVTTATENIHNKTK